MKLPNFSERGNPLKELSLHILDIVQNSIKAKAKDITIDISEKPQENLLEITIADNGHGMSPELLNRVRDPFSTTRTTRKVGLGIPLFEAAAKQCGGKLEINSEEGVGTTLYVCFEYHNIDRAPIGDMAQTMQTIILSDPDINYVYTHKKADKEFIFDTKEIKKVLGDVSISSPEILEWICEYINEGLS